MSADSCGMAGFHCDVASDTINYNPAFRSSVLSGVTQGQFYLRLQSSDNAAVIAQFEIRQARQLADRLGMLIRLADGEKGSIDTAGVERWPVHQ